jgi:hypothetical protein
MREFGAKRIKTRVWSGFYTTDDIDDLIRQLKQDEPTRVDVEHLRAVARDEFDSWRAAQATWPAVTDCDRLDRAYAELERIGIIALPNVGYDMSDGLDAAFDELSERGRDGIAGYCFYHEQDLARAVNGDGLWLAFGDFDNDNRKSAAIGRKIKDVLDRFGFTVNWDGKAGTRLKIVPFDWKSR